MSVQKGSGIVCLAKLDFYTPDFELELLSIFFPYVGLGGYYSVDWNTGLLDWHIFVFLLMLWLWLSVSINLVID